MPKRPDFILQIAIRNIEDFSPEAIVKSPRSSRLTDVQQACANLSIQAPSGTPQAVQDLADFILRDFFVLCHSSGLYNRQIKLWDGLSRTSIIEIRQACKGLFGQNKLPEFDLAFLDHRMRPQILAHFVLPGAESEEIDNLKSCREFLKRAAQVQSSGLFLCYPSPFPHRVLDFIRKETNATDSIARYESRLPRLGVSVNLIEIDRSPTYNPDKQLRTQRLHLVHPDLGKKKLGATAIPGADMNQLDQTSGLEPAQLDPAADKLEAPED